jgi:hypothetical protein
MDEDVQGVGLRAGAVGKQRGCLFQTYLVDVGDREVRAGVGELDGESARPIPEAAPVTTPTFPR